MEIHCKIAEFCAKRKLHYAGIVIKDINVFSFIMFQTDQH